MYSVLSLWMSIAGTCSSIKIFADEIIPIIVADVEFVKPSVKLTVSVDGYCELKGLTKLAFKNT